MSDHYVGLDVHKASICIAVLNTSGKLVQQVGSGGRPQAGATAERVAKGARIPAPALEQLVTSPHAKVFAAVVTTGLPQWRQVNVTLTNGVRD